MSDKCRHGVPWEHPTEFCPTCLQEAARGSRNLATHDRLTHLESENAKLRDVLAAARVITRQEGPENNGRYRVYDPGPIGTGEDTCRVSVPYAPWDELSKAIRLCDQSSAVGEKDGGGDE